MARSTDLPSLRSLAARDVAAQTAVRVLNLGLSLIASLVLVRGLGDAGFGEWATITAITQTLTWLGELGLEAAAVRRAAAEPNLEPAILGALVTVRVLVAVPIAILCAAIGLLVATRGEMAT